MADAKPVHEPGNVLCFTGAGIRVCLTGDRIWCVRLYLGIKHDPYDCFANQSAYEGELFNGITSNSSPEDVESKMGCEAQKSGRDQVPNDATNGPTERNVDWKSYSFGEYKMTFRFYLNKLFELNVTKQSAISYSY